MNHQQLEKDIEHLERVFSHISAEDRIPLSYWRNRIDFVSSVVQLPAQVIRVRRLIAALTALETRQKISSAVSAEGRAGVGARAAMPSRAAHPYI